MKRNLYLIITLPLINLLAYGQVNKLVQQTSNSLTIEQELTPQDLQNIVIQNQSYIDFSKNNKIVGLQAGAPMLPVFNTRIKLPATGKPILIVESVDYTDVADVLVAPSKGNLKRNVVPSEVPYAFGAEYTANAFFPQNVSVLNDPFIWRSLRGAVVTFNPYQYNPVTKILRIHHKIRVKIEFQEDVEGVNELVVWNDKVFSESQRDFTLNKSTEKYTSFDEEGEMVVIAPTSYAAVIRPFVNWKNQKGIKTTLVSTDVAGTSTTAIKAYLTTFFNANPNTAYVLLVGDHAQVPCHSYGTSGGEQLYSDSYYGMISGNDYYPELLVGRFSGTTTDVTTMVTRTLEYEKTPAAGNWMEKAIGVASAEGPGDDNEYDDVHMRNIRTKLMGFGYTTVHEFYDGSQGGSDASGNPTPSIVQTAVNSGAGLFNYTGHGDQNTCVTSNYSSTEIAAATNTGFYPLVVSVACNNGTFTSGTCISESWTRAKKNAGPTGALAAAGSSILMAWAPPMETQDEMAEIIAQTVPANNKNKIGGIFYNGQISMLSEYGSQGNEIMQTWIFFGDPSAQFRNKQTLPITVSHTANVPQSATSVTVNCNVAGALVAISQGDVLLGFGAAAGGSAVITIPTLANDNPLLVTATKQNYATYQGNIQVGNGALSLNENQLEFVVYPNPASDQFTVKGANLLNTEISIVSFTGQVVKTIVATENNAVQIDVNDLANGSYLLQMKSNEGVTIKKIQIIK